MERPRSLSLIVFALISALSGIGVVATLIWPDWIELLFRIDPDEGSGWLEAVVVVGVGLVSAICGVYVLARLTARRPNPAGEVDPPRRR